MRSFLAALGAAALLAFTAVPASSQPADLQPSAVAADACDPAGIIGQITFCNPLGTSRGVGAGLGRL
jgi:hypothetical protein